MGYRADHLRVERRRGKARTHACVDCGMGALDWAHTHDTDPSDPENYRPLCRKCHSRYDDKGAAHRGPKSPEVRAKISASLLGKTKSRETRSRMADSARAARARRKKEQE